MLRLDFLDQPAKRGDPLSASGTARWWDQHRNELISFPLSQLLSGKAGFCLPQLRGFVYSVGSDRLISEGCFADEIPVRADV